MSVQHHNISSDPARGKFARLMAERQGFERRIDALLAVARTGRANWREVRRVHAALDDSVERGVWVYREGWLEFLRERLNACCDAMAELWDVAAAALPSC